MPDEDKTFSGSLVLEWYYDENRLFPVTHAILRHKQVACVRRKMMFTYDIKISFFVAEILKFLKHAN